MSQIAVDTEVASYIFNWHSLAQQYADTLGGSELVLSFMTIAELRMGAISAGWVTAGAFQHDTGHAFPVDRAAAPLFTEPETARIDSPFFRDSGLKPGRYGVEAIFAETGAISSNSCPKGGSSMARPASCSTCPLKTP